jgi:hypothetical protein
MLASYRRQPSVDSHAPRRYNEQSAANRRSPVAEEERMRTIIGIVLLTAWVGAPASVRAGDRDKALAVIEQSIKAHGGAEALTKAQTRSRSGQGVLTLSGDVPFTTEETVRLPDCCRMVLETGRNRVILVLNGDKGWMLPPGGAVQEMNKEQFGDRREEIYVWWLMTLTPLRKDSFELTPLPDTKVNGQEAAVIKVARKGHADVSLFFDKRTALLIKIARRAKEAGVPLDKDYYYSDHRDFEGAKLPGKEIITLNGKKLSEVKFAGYKLLPKLDESTFNKP